ncbi:hypothetical protein ONZ45_g10892 [Pleurotus djamor]|nr:hypothetical protein ONZ45_g10892 [Pleurotus djamor]
MASHRVLHLPDILRELVSLVLGCQPGYSSDLALVCKDWAEVVLDYTWREASASQLFKLLAPLSWDQSHQSLCFSQPITNDGWSSFQKYHRRIRTLRCTEPLLHPCVYTIAGINRPYSGPFLPNLTFLECACNAVDIHLFASPSIKTLDLKDQVDASSQSKQEYELTLKYLPFCTPNLEKLSLSARPEKQPIQNALAEALAALRCLTQIHIPTMLLMPEVITAISRLPLLKSLQGHHRYIADLSQSLSCTFDSGSFPVLERLKLEGDLFQATLFLKKWVPPASLTGLNFMEQKAILPTNYSAITKWVASRAPLITELVITYDEDEVEEDPAFSDPLPFSIFEPLFSCKHLSTLAIAFPVPFEITKAQLVTLVTALPSLRSLEIGCSREISESDSEPSLSLSALSLIAPLCKSLQHLGIYLSCQITSHLEDIAAPSNRFKTLKSLHVGKSPIHSPVSVALFLSWILPDSCHLYHSNSYSSGEEDWDADWRQADMVLKALRIRCRGAKNSG